MAEKILDQIMESEEVQSVLEENKEIIAEATESAYNFSKILKSFVLSNPEEFMGESIDETFKNVRVFSEVATAQYMTEISEIAGENLKITEKTDINDYL